MTELLKRLTEADRWFIDGMTNQMCGYYSDENFDCEPKNIPFITLFSIVETYMNLCDRNIMLRHTIHERWKNEDNKDGIYQDLYDEIFETYDMDFLRLSLDHPVENRNEPVFYTTL